MSIILLLLRFVCHFAVNVINPSSKIMPASTSNNGKRSFISAEKEGIREPCPYAFPDKMRKSMRECGVFVTMVFDLLWVAGMRTMRIDERIKVRPWVFVSVCRPNTVSDWFSFFNARGNRFSDISYKHRNNRHIFDQHSLRALIFHTSAIAVCALCQRWRTSTENTWNLITSSSNVCITWIVNAQNQALYVSVLETFFCWNQFCFASNVEKSILHFEHSIAQIHISKYKLNFISRFTIPNKIP